MALVEQKRAVEGGAAAPVDELLQPRLALLLLRARRDERGVRGEEHALLQPFRHPEAERAAVELLRAVVHRDVAAQIAQIALRVVPQVAARAEPQVLRAPRARLSRTTAASWRPLPTPAPSPMKKPARVAAAPGAAGGSSARWRSHASATLSTCSDETLPSASTSAGSPSAIG